MLDHCLYLESTAKCKSKHTRCQCCLVSGPVCHPILGSLMLACYLIGPIHISHYIKEYLQWSAA